MNFNFSPFRINTAGTHVISNTANASKHINTLFIVITMFSFIIFVISQSEKTNTNIIQKKKGFGLYLLNCQCFKIKRENITLKNEIKLLQ